MTDRSFRLGDVVRTRYGVGVVVAVTTPQGPDDDAGHSIEKSFYQVLLWRSPERSVGSSSVAHLQPDTILDRLPGAPGMVTSLKSGEKVMIYSYYSSTNTFLVKHVNEASNRWSFVPFIEELPSEPSEGPTEAVKTGDFVEVTPDQLQPAPSAKFYPLLQELVRRGDAAASATSSFLTSKTVTKIVQKTTDLVESSTEAVLKKDIAVDTLISKESVEQLASTVEHSIPTYSEEVKQVVAMLKDEELTVLLKKGQERLKELMSTDISKATEQALGNIGIRVVAADSGVTDFSASIAESRETALKALETILKEVDMDTVDLESVRLQLEGNFTTMFDSLAQAAKSDRTLNSIFDTIAGKTTEWQEASGRFMSTRSASLFMEGASRIQARAANLFSKDQLEWAGEIGSKLTKAFTEGDAALARLKSIELGEGLRDRLVAAIEIRSESLGGLDGIIAGALTSVRQQGDSAVGQIQNMLTHMQKSASSVTTDARETLISILSHRSEYRDVALLHLEKVLCDLEFQLSDDLSPEDIAAIARGEGGTAQIFEPIARRAGKEIEKQLDAAEASITDPTMLDVLKHVRKIVSGELTLSSVMDEVVNILNDDNVVAAGESLVQQGESVLDAIEGVSSNKVVDDVMKIAEKAGITKDTVMKQVESLDVNQLLDTAGSAVTDEKKRRQLISSATDTALDFILRILPSMPVPPLNGVKDGLVYHISNLSMEGFKVRKEDISLVLAGIQATSKKKRDSITFETQSSGLTPSDSASTLPTIPSTTSFDSQDLVETDSYGAVKATELLIIDVQHISAVLDETVWSFEQTYMPYLKGGGSANVKLSDGAIRLQFELRRRRKPKTEGSDAEWEPVLCLHDRSCSIGEVDLVLQGQGRWTWILNKLASIFKGPLRDYVVRSIVGVLTTQSGWILEHLNANLAPYWDLILRTSGLQLEELVEAGDEVVVAAVKSKDDGLVELVWRERVPLGMNLLLNDESGLLKVVDFPRGSQARSVCTERQIDPDLFKGATVVAVNGFRYDLQDDLFEALRDPGRPKSVQFELANSEDAERIKRFVEGNDATEDAKANGVSEPEVQVGSLRAVTFTEPGELGIEFAILADTFGLVVTGFIEGEAGTVLAAERQGQIKVGDLLCQVNGEFVLGENGSGTTRAMQLLESSGTTRPLTLSFADSYLYRDVFKKPVDVEVGGPSELKLVERHLPNSSRRIKLAGFEDVSGRAELAGVFIGDHLLFINGIPVGGGCRWLGDDHSPNMNEVNALLKDEKRYPIGLTFGRPKQETKSRWSSSPRHAGFDPENAETICVTAERYDQLGCVLEMQLDWSIVVTNFEAVPGPMQSTILQHVSKEEAEQLAIESVNGQFVPSYATCDIVRNAMKRSWSTHGQVEVLLCNDSRKDWIHSLLQQK